MARLNIHIIKKYNNTLGKVLEYYDLSFNWRYAKTFRGILYLDLNRLGIGFESRET